MGEPGLSGSAGDGPCFLRGVSISTFQNSGEQGFASNWTKQVNGKNAIGRSCDFWNRSREDIALARNLCINAFRLTLEWHRLEPMQNVFDMDAFARYKRILDNIKEAGMSVVVSLHHFVHPAWFEALGGFAVEENIDYFVNFVQRVAEMFHYDVDRIVTFDEAAVYAVAGNVLGVFPPGGVMNYHRAGLVLLNMLKAHTRAYHTIKAEDLNIQVGFVHRFIELFSQNSSAAKSPFISSQANEAFATDTVLRWFKVGTFSWQGAFLFGRNIHHQAPQPPPLDFLGINASPPPLPTLSLRVPSSWKSALSGALTGTSAAMADAHSRSLSRSLSGSSAASGRLGGEPEDGGRPGAAAEAKWTQEELRDHAGQLKSALLRTARMLGKPMMVMDFGVDDKEDELRPQALREYYCSILEAMEQGADITGVFYWTLTDTYEWNDGFRKHFGMFTCSYPTLERRPRWTSINLMLVINSLLPSHIVDVRATTGGSMATIKSLWRERGADGHTHWKFVRKDLINLVLFNRDMLYKVFSRVTKQREAGVILLTCKTWNTVMKNVLEGRGPSSAPPPLPPPGE